MNRSRPLVVLVLALALALVTAACGNDDSGATSTDATSEPTAEATEEATAEATEEATEQATESPGAEGAFPVTIEHKFGETTVLAEPQRVVTVGFSDQDDLLALGVVPIGIRDWYGDQPFGTWPWAQDELGDASPELLSNAELNFEQIAALDPDLIVGVSSGMTESDYETLSQIAPTIAQPGEYVDYGTPWDERLQLVGDAVGQSERATELIEDIESQFEQIRSEHPDWEGQSVAVAFVFDDSPGAYASSDVRARLLGELGFVTPAEYDEIAGDSFFASISEEQLELLDTDLIVWIAGSDEGYEAVQNLALRDALAASQEGREVFADVLLSGAFSFASPLSIQYMIDELIPQIVEVTAAGTGDEGGEDGEDGEDGAAMEAWAVVFDSTTSLDDKAAHLEDADALASTIDAYATTGETMGGISLEPTAVSIDGDTATVTYDVYFGEAAAYNDVEGTMTLVDGVWVVSRSEFCGFMASARTPCE